MRSLRPAVPLVVALALLAPSAAAANASGQLQADALALADGTALASAGLDIATRGLHTPSLDIEATEVSLQRFGRSEAREDLAGRPISVDNQAINERATHQLARLTLVPGEGHQILALRALGPATATLDAAQMRAVAGALVGTAGIAGSEAADDPAADARCDSATCLDTFGAYELTSAATAQLSGEFTLLLYGPTLRVLGDDGREVDYESGLKSTEQTGPITRTEDAWVVVRAAAVRGTFVAPEALLYSAAPTLRTSQASFEGADGDVRVGAVQYHARGDDVAATGALILTPGPVAPGTTHADPRTGAPVYAPSFTTRVSGDVATIDLDGNIAFLDTPAERAGAAALLAGVVAAVAYGWQHLAFAGAALYTRLSKPDILENDVRNAIYDIIRQTPGISAREVHRRSNQSWGTVVYHLRQLERHHLVVSRALGRTRNYYENHGKYRGMEVQLACLQSDRARALARAIVAEPGITQEQLAVVCGFPQPTTSYYVRKLKLAGLVEEQREGRYAKYVPHADLPRFIELSDNGPQTGAAATTGIQA